EYLSIVVVFARQIETTVRTSRAFFESIGNMTDFLASCDITGYNVSTTRFNQCDSLISTGVSYGRYAKDYTRFTTNQVSYDKVTEICSGSVDVRQRYYCGCTTKGRYGAESS